MKDSLRQLLARPLAASDTTRLGRADRISVEILDLLERLAPDCLDVDCLVLALERGRFSVELAAKQLHAAGYLTRSRGGFTPAYWYRFRSRLPRAKPFERDNLSLGERPDDVLVAEAEVCAVLPLSR